MCEWKKDKRELRPLDDAVIVDDNVWLRKKRGETLGDIEFFGTLPSVVWAARTPAVKERAVAMKLPDMRDDGWNRMRLLPAVRTRVSFIDVDAKLATHRGIGAFLSPMFHSQFSNENQKSLQSQAFADDGGHLG